MMKRSVFLISFFFLLQGIYAQQVEIIKKDRLFALMQPQDSKTYIINFWASWCGPCVKELPGFKKLSEKYKDKNIEIVLISLDFKEDLNKAKALLTKKGIQFNTFLLDETDYDSWIDQVEPTWQGAIPATIIMNRSLNQRKFLNKELSQEELEKELLSFL